MNLPQNKTHNLEEFLMNIITQEAKKRQAVVECAIKNDVQSSMIGYTFLKKI